MLMLLRCIPTGSAWLVLSALGVMVCFSCPHASRIAIQPWLWAAHNTVIALGKTVFA